MNHVLQGLLPGVQIILFLCLFVLVIGTSTLLLVVACSFPATGNLFYLFATVIDLLKLLLVRPVNPHSQKMHSASFDAEKFHQADKSE